MNTSLVMKTKQIIETEIYVVVWSGFMWNVSCVYGGVPHCYRQVNVIVIVIDVKFGQIWSLIRRENFLKTPHTSGGSANGVHEHCSVNTDRIDNMRIIEIEL